MPGIYFVWSISNENTTVKITVDMNPASEVNVKTFVFRLIRLKTLSLFWKGNQTSYSTMLYYHI